VYLIDLLENPRVENRGDLIDGQNPFNFLFFLIDQEPPSMETVAVREPELGGTFEYVKTHF
jgi:hypothetical protein